MKIAILGFAREGMSAYEHWSVDGNEITICDKNTDVIVPLGAKSKLGDEYLQNFEGFDLLVRTPSLHPGDILKANPQTTNILNQVTSVTNEFFRICPSQNIIGVTGTKGKGTTSTLIAKMLEAAGMRVHLGGNIGTPTLELLKNNIQPEDWVVLEMSNFQLIDLKYSPHIAVCLMVEPEHLDWHEDHDEYIAAKQQLFMNQTVDDVAIYYAGNANSETIADASVGTQISYMGVDGLGAVIQNDTVMIDGQEICKTSDVKLLGEHNLQNVCAAVTATWQATKDINAIRSGIIIFSGLPFRIEFRAEKNGVRYYNDSFAVGSGACIAAIKAVPGQKVIIIGGYDRNLDLKPLADGLIVEQANIRRVVLIGQSAQRTAEVLRSSGFDNFEICNSRNMAEIVKTASALASIGDAVVLSPGFASYDMFKDFEERGEKFNEAVEAL